MDIKRDWKKYFESTKGKKPRELLVRALPYVKERSSALDLGSGAFNDVLYLLSEDFGYVTALDRIPVAQAIADTLPADKFTYAISRLEDFNFPKEQFDLINAQYVLPFINPDKFADVWSRIGDSLKPGGIITGQMFGERDGWTDKSDMNFHTKEEAQKLLSGYETLIFEEVEKDQATADNIMKHWHIFHFVARK